MLFGFLLLLVVSVHGYCPPGFIHNSTNSTHSEYCVCGKELEGIIDCDSEKGSARLAIGFCIHFNFTTNSTIVGRCPYNSNYSLTELGTVSRYVSLYQQVCMS